MKAPVAGSLRRSNMNRKEKVLVTVLQTGGQAGRWAGGQVGGQPGGQGRQVGKAGMRL